jgi:hypothetical protein
VLLAAGSAGLPAASEVAFIALMLVHLGAFFATAMICPRHFSFLADCAPDAEVRIGDARLTLERAPAGGFDLLILDAFSSDSIPTHLLTREAFDLYERRLAPGGFLLMHISNRHLDLAPVVARLASETGLSARLNGFMPTDPESLTLASRWVALARDPAALSFLDDLQGWQPLVADTGSPVWSDDYADIVGAMRW